MKVILLKKIAKLGNIGDIVKVSPGFARNFLIRFGAATLATNEAIASFKEKQDKLFAAAELDLESAKRRAAEMNDIEITLTAKAGATGKLFGSFTAKDLAGAITQAGFKTEKREIMLPNGPIRSVGEYNIGVHLHADVNASIRVIVVAEEE
jgi:large subunit ribosomal protein L9